MVETLEYVPILTKKIVGEKKSNIARLDPLRLLMENVIFQDL